ncbi:class II aldolase/adducin family protein [Amnibacterium flavum]|uniref:Class II aldolase/adducin N-terminal domain-containing protein n=1 Tax=Amnibacterium flavum TaxID=2173173 RepID=A0A2V1HX82_9MICO|nr:class II aldolase/adducin family protein [Amnibacterium flavum]PVZ95860.1 hypothetical protein DDQ50_05190 [Amnibacterium flavum]
MSDSTDMLPRGVEDMKSFALEIGHDLRLVQGAGGNLSVKVDNTLWIKASGTRLAEATARPIFVPLRLAETRAAVLETESFGHLVRADYADSGLRPSIETALHALLPHAFVFHTHSTGAIAWGLSLDGHPISSEGWFDLLVVPYAKPGLELARAVMAALGSGTGSERPLALLLVNHGVVTAADDAATAAAVTRAVHARFASAAPPASSPVDSSGTPEGWRLLHPAGTVGEGASRLLRLGALTPDEAVFLGPHPFATRDEADDAAAIVTDDGAVWLRDDLGQDEAEIAISIVDVARLSDAPRARALTASEVDSLINWEAEKWRRSLKR